MSLFCVSKFFPVTAVAKLRRVTCRELAYFNEWAELRILLQYYV